VELSRQKNVPFLMCQAYLSISRRKLGCTNMDCEDVRQEIELYVLGGADETESRLIEEHLSRCPDCRQIERQCVLLLTNLRRQKRSSGADSELVARILAATELPLKRALKRKRLRRVTPTAVSIAAVLLLAAFVWQIWWGESDKGVVPSAGQVHAPSIPAKTLWHKAPPYVWRTIGVGFTNADDIVVDKGAVFFLSGDTSRPVVTAVDADSGQTKWQSDTISCGYLETDGERLYCVALTGRPKSELAALDVRSGRVQWTFERPEASNSLYQPSKPTVMPATRICWVCKNVIYALDARTGGEIWRRTIDGESCMSRAAVVGDNIYAAGRSGIYCVNADSGEVRWHLAYRFYTWPGSKPLIASAGSGRLFVAAGSKDGRSLVRRIDTATPRCIWEKLVPRVAHISVDSTHVYLRCQDVLALDQATGDLVWKVKAAGCSPVTECDDLVCFIDRTRDGRLIAINRQTGRITWQVPGLHSCNAFVKVGGRGYLKTEDSVVLAFTFGS
jgi:outer membrane protein assembly factor BamB